VFNWVVENPDLQETIISRCGGGGWGLCVPPQARCSGTRYLVVHFLGRRKAKVKKRSSSKRGKPGRKSQAHLFGSSGKKTGCVKEAPKKESNKVKYSSVWSLSW